MKFKSILGSIALAALAASAAVPAAAQELKKVNISYQAGYWALPLSVASQKGWWKEVGLEVTPVMFAAGAPQIAAVPAKSWDIGGLGIVPAILGQVRFKLKMVGIATEEGGVNTLYATGEAAARMKTPANWKGEKILVTTNSNGDYIVQACLKKAGLSKQDVQLVNMAPAQIVTTLAGRQANLGITWAPQTFALEKQAGGVPLCSGRDAGVFVPNVLVAREDYAAQNPEVVAKVLAVYLRGWSWAKANPDEARDALKAFFTTNGVYFDEESLKKEVAGRVHYSLAEELAHMARDSGASSADKWVSDVAAFMQANGSIPAVPDPRGWITNEYLLRVQNDKALAAVAAKTQ